ncbi:hypothetical protein GCM10007919_15720 [Rhizobium indigoferae]|nr:hypothetical protein GCM10007919_15720 [Rhizobium indigoferae]
MSAMRRKVWRSDTSGGTVGPPSRSPTSVGPFSQTPPGTTTTAGYESRAMGPERETEACPP